MKILLFLMKRYLFAAFAAYLAPDLLRAQTPDAAREEAFKAKVRPYLARNCAGCHNASNKTGGIAVDGLKSAATLGAEGEEWEKILRKVKTGEMPPSQVPRPPADQTAAFAGFVESELDRLAAAQPDPGRVTIHRLNRAEYNNAVRDLFAIDYTPADDFPADDSGYGFDNVADVLSLPPLLMEKYLSAANKITRQITGFTKVSAALEKYVAERRRPQKDRISDDLPFGTRGGLLATHRFPADGEYLFRFRVNGGSEPGQPPPVIDFRLDGVRVKTIDARTSAEEAEEEKRRFELRIPVQAGLRQVAATFLAESYQQEGMRQPRPVSLDFVEIGGPFQPSLPRDSATRRRVYICSTTDDACARRILSGVARRAYRRTPTFAESAKLMRFYAMGKADASSARATNAVATAIAAKAGATNASAATAFEAGIQLGLKSILVSPSFLFRREAERAGAIQPISDLDMASRLSFFLWSSIPDDELLTLAEQKKLNQPEVLRAQVRRMLADQRSEALVTNFGGQWLQLRNVAALKPDPDKFPEFDAELRTALLRETELFFGAIVKEDRSVLDLLDGKYSYLNERLAKHYGVPGVKGTRFRRVDLDGAQRSGVLTHASILTIASYPTRTSPVIRGKWILENILGAPPPPPPPDVPELDTKGAGEDATLRQKLQAHRANASCAACHDRMDGVGFLLENYDPIGRYRDKDGKLPIDATSGLNGRKLNGAADLKAVLRERKSEFVETLVERLLTYGLGRGLERYDKPVVRAISRDVARQDYRFSSVVLGIVESLPFQKRRGVEISKAPPLRAGTAGAGAVSSRNSAELNAKAEWKK